MTGVDVGFDLSTGELLLAAIDPGDFVGYVALGILVGFLSGLFGVGGGFLLTPLLNVLFGLPYNLAVGSSLVQITVASWVGTRQHIRLGHVDHRLGFALLTGSFLGAETGVRMQASLRAIGDIEVGGKVLSGFDLSMAFLFIVLLTCLGWAMLVETRRSLLRTSARSNVNGSVHDRTHREEAATQEGKSTADQSGAYDFHHKPGAASSTEPQPSRLAKWLNAVTWKPRIRLTSDAERRISLWVPAGIGFFVAILTGLLGAGGGIIIMPVLIYVLGVPTVIGIGTSSLIVSCVAVYSGLRYIMQGMVVWPVVVALLLGSVIGVHSGARFSDRIANYQLRRSFAYTLLVTAAVIALDAGRRLLAA